MEGTGGHAGANAFVRLRSALTIKAAAPQSEKALTLWGATCPRAISSTAGASTPNLAPPQIHRLPRCTSGREDLADGRSNGGEKHACPANGSGAPPRVALYRPVIAGGPRHVPGRRLERRQPVDQREVDRLT